MEVREDLPAGMRVAVVHDWLDGYYGAERVLEQIIELFPHADLFVVVDFLPENGRTFVANKPAAKTFLQRFPFVKKHYRKYFFLMPLAIEQHDLSNYDLVISSSHAVAKGVLSGPGQLHVSYLHTPGRYAWDLQHAYLKDGGLDAGFSSAVVRWLLHKFRLWDVVSANRVDHFVANSRFVRARAMKIYRREAHLIYPPVDIEYFALSPKKEEFYVTVSRLVSYKKVELVVRAFNEMPHKQLVVIGDGVEAQRLKSIAASNVRFLGYASAQIVRSYLQRSNAFVFAGEEDFGIAMVEAQACGTPVLALARGGAVESVIGLGNEQPTGIFFHEQNVQAVIAAVNLFEVHREAFTPENCRKNAMRFSKQRFRDEFYHFVCTKWTLHKKESNFGCSPRP